jgi:hypothetical protein
MMMRVIVFVVIRMIVVLVGSVFVHYRVHARCGGAYWLQRERQ